LDNWNLKEEKLIKRLAIFQFLVLFILPILFVEPVGAALERIGYFRAKAHYYVDAVHGSDSTGDGSSSSPWKTITFALGQVAGSEVEIHVAAGTYNNDLGEIFPLTIDAGISIIGSDRDNVIISGMNDRSVMHIDGSTNNILSDTVLSNITLQNGNIGLQIYSTESHIAEPAISTIRSRWNTIGIHISTSDVYHNGATISGIISNAEVISNDDTGIFIRSYGYFTPSDVSPMIVDSHVSGNGSHGIYIQGSAVSNNGTTAAPQIVSTHIMNNGGHGVFAEGTYNGWSNPKIERSRIKNNQGYGFYWEQGINRGNINANITNTVIASNLGGGIFLDRRSYYGVGTSMLRLINSTVSYNENYGFYWQRTSPYPNWDVTPLVINTILWNPSADDLYSTGASWTTTEIQYSDIEDGDLDGQVGNMTQDPLFFDATKNNYFLTISSPVIDIGDNVNCPSTDIRGLSRPQNGICDIGAYELGKPTTTTISDDSPDPSLVGQSFTIQFSVSSSYGVPSGMVKITDGSTSESCSGELVGGSGSCQISIDTLGEHTLTAVYLGNESFDPSKDTESHIVKLEYVYLPLAINR
jgi:hypothetical protein